MTLGALRDDALASTFEGFALGLSLPWIRSLPVASLTGLAVSIDHEPTDVLIAIDGRRVAPEDLAAEPGWWFLQDRLLLEGRRMLRPGEHEVAVSFVLVIPYLQAGPSGPLALPFRVEAMLTLDAEHTISPPTTFARARSTAAAPGLPDGWTLAASAFNWTPEVIRAERAATDIATGIVTDAVADVIEIEPGQLWRSFPEPTDDDVDAFARALGAVGGSVSIVGASLDEWSTPARRRDDDERLAFLVPQLRAASRVGAHGVRLPIGQAGEPLLRRVQPLLEELDLTLYEEIQGHQTPDAAASAVDVVSSIDDPRVRLLVDISMIMPALPPSYLDLLSRGGVPAALVTRLTDEWQSPDTAAAVVALLREGGVPPQVHTMYMNLLIRFGRSHAADLRGVLPLVGAFHLKFWDLDDADERVSSPIRDLGVVLREGAWRGTLCSEWGGHEWLDDEPALMTRAHLAIATAALTARDGE
jgi:hypothetical protein